MNANHHELFPLLAALLIFFIGVVLYQERRFFRFVRTYWFYRRSTASYLASFLFLLGASGLFLSLLDFRGPEEKVKTEVPRERTIILIDTSASMLAEDVKPSRLHKAALIAKHFARKAAGHQLSIIAFAEIQKKIVPFTNDLDLIDARLDSIENLRNQYGSSALSSAIQESVQYFREGDGEARGNILVLTDGEETAEGLDLNVPKSINIALVGVGTAQGGRIPLDDGRGLRFGYKKDRGRDVITKLDESFFKRAVADLPKAKYWPANSYSLPSEEILDFFRSERKKGNEQQDMVIKPVMMEWIVLPALALITLSYCLKFVRIFTLGLILFWGPVQGQEQETGPKLTPELIQRLERLQTGELNRIEKLKLADDLQRAGAKDESLSLYRENLPSPVDPSLPPEAYLNYGTSLLQSGDAAAGLGIYDKLSQALDDSAKSREIKGMMEKNAVSFFQQQEQKKEQKKEQDKKDQSEKKDQQSKPQQGDGNQKDPQQGKSDQDQKQDSKKNEPGKPRPDEQKKDSQKSPPEDTEKGQEKGPEEEKDKPSEEPKEGNPEKKLPPKKLPAKLKQLMSDDRQLQMKMIENGTRDLNRRKSRKSKDW